MWLTYAILGTLGVGCADFAAALAGRRTRVPAEIFAVTLLQHTVAVATMGVGVLAFGAGDAGGRDLALAVFAGVSLAVMKPLLYAGLAFGSIPIFAPIAAVVSIVVPVGFALASGEWPGPLAGVGIGLAFPAVVLVARERGAEPGLWPTSRTIGSAVVAGGLIGVNSIAFGEMHSSAGLLPTFVSACVALPGIALATAFMREGALPAAPARPPSIVAGLFEGFGFALVVLGLQQGLLSVASAVFALAPVVPVVLAWTWLEEEVDPYHAFGVALACAAVVLMTIG